MSDRFEHTLESKADEPGDTGLVRRIELLTGTGRRRQWSDDEKARIIIESLRPGANVSEVARRNGLSPQQLFGWRREARTLMAAGDGATADAPRPDRAVTSPRGKQARSRLHEVARSPAEVQPAFAPVVIAASPPSPPAGPPTSGRIEITIGDAVVRVVGQVEPALLVAVLRAVRRAA